MRSSSGKFWSKPGRTRLATICFIGGAGVALCQDSAAPRATPPGNEFLIESWQVEDGVPRHSVRSLLQTRDGYLWVGTYHGLGRFDGNHFTLFNTATTTNLISDSVAVLYEDHEGTLWIGTTGGGLARYEEGRFQSVRLETDPPAELVEQITEDKNGTLWIVTSWGLFKRKEGAFHREELAPDVISPRTYLMALAPCNDGTLLLGTARGLCRLGKGKIASLESLKNRSVWSLAFDQEGSLWCGGTGEPGLQRIDGQEVYNHPAFSSNLVDCLYPGRDGSLWIGTREGTLWRMKGDQVTLCFAAPAGTSQRIQCITDDRDGNIWFGARASGLSRLSRKLVLTQSKRDGLPSDEVTCICEDSAGQVLLGTFGNGVHWISDGLPRPIHPGLRTGEIATMVATRDGNMLIGGFYGTVWRWHDQELKPQQRYPDLHVMLEDRHGRLWVGTRMSGVICEAPTGQQHYSTAEGLSHNRVYCLAEDAHGAIWVGTEHGINRIDNGHVEAFRREQGMPAELFQAIWTEPDGTVWIGSTGGGLVRWREGQVRTITTRQGLVNDSIEQILGDGSGNLWVGTQLGLMRLSLSDLNRCADGQQSFLHGKLLDRDDGLLVPNCGTEYSPSCFKARDGRLWFAMRSGLLIVDPTRLEMRTNPPAIYVEQVFADGIVVARGHRVPARTHNLRIEFAAVDLSAPKKVRFRRWLEGYDQQWLESGNERFAIYTKVPPGDYTFHVTACNSDGFWNPLGASLAVTVAPAWWQTRWAQLLGTLMVVGLVVAYIQSRILRLERRRAEQETFARLLIDSHETERRRIASELHDSLGQILLTIKNRALLGLKTTASSDIMRQRLREISEASNNSIEEVRSIARGLRPYQLDRLGLTSTLQDVAELVTKSGGPKVTTQVDSVDGLFAPEVEISIYRMVQEGLNNAVKHAAASSVELTVERQSRVVAIKLSDNGCGFDPDQAYGFGLTGIRERVQLLGGTLTIDSSRGRGSCLSVEIPLPSNAARLESSAALKA